ncbi:MAG: transketolase [Spirosomaceae bacterium]|jgi:transketolase|nr:transketolase [Spirosomataceae bacterium]
MTLTQNIPTDLHQLSGNLRLRVLGLYKQANAGHIGCSLSCIDLLIAALIHQKRAQDSFILSKGHAAAALYVALNHLGEISDETLDTFYQDGTTLPAHPAPNQHKGIPFATGSLGHGLPIATGIAHASKLSGEDAYSYVLMSDGETNEGTTWEAVHYAIQNRLDNLIVLIDKNGLQGFGNTTDILGETASAAKWKAMGFEVIEADGHDVTALIEGIEMLKNNKNGLPKVIIAHTVKGKGVSYMENRMEWHYLPMSDELYENAIFDIKKEYLLS